MKIKIILLATILILSTTAINCDRSISPFAPETEIQEQTGNAMLIGTVVLTGSNVENFSLIQIRIKGTGLQENPDENGDFRIDNLPLGNIIVEIDIKNNISDIPIYDVLSGEEIKVIIEVQADNKAILANMDRNKKSTEGLQVQIRPNKWNTAWASEESEDEIVAKISGEGFADIDPGSIKMKCSGAEIFPYTYEVGGVYFMAKFLQKKAIGLITDPKTGDIHEIQVVGNFGDGIGFELSETIIIVGKKQVKRELSLEIKPDKWNKAWGDSNEGYVTAKISGEGFADIDPGSVKMRRTGDEIFPYAYEVGEVYFMAKFLKKEAIGIIADSIPENSLEIQVEGKFSDGSTFTLSYTIKIVGPDS